MDLTVNDDREQSWRSVLRRGVMDRRQVLFGASALGLVTNLNLNHPLIAQVGTAVMGRPVCPKCGNVILSDRERAGLRGPVKTCIDLIEGGRIKSINTDFSP